MTTTAKKNSSTSTTPKPEKNDKETAVKELKYDLKILKLETALVGKYYSPSHLKEKETKIKNLTSELLKKL